MRTHFSVTQSSIIAAFTAVVTQLIAYVPAWATDKSEIISGGGIVIAAVFLVANAIHHLAASKAPSSNEVLQVAHDVVRGEVGKVDFNSLVQDAVNAKGIGDIEGMVKAEVQRLISGAFAPTTPTMPAPPAPAVSTTTTFQ